MGKLDLPENTIVSMYVAERKTLVEISEAVKCHPSTIERRLKKLGVQIRPPGWMAGKPHTNDTKQKMSISHVGLEFSEEHRKNLSAAKLGVPQPKMRGANNPMKRPEIIAKFKGENNPMKRPEIAAKSGAAKRGIPRSEETKKKLSVANFGHHHTEETKCKIGKSIEGYKHWNWQGGIARLPYCPKFNNRLKEEIRIAHGRTCFLCPTTESENGRKLDVHHADFNKGQGCRHVWNLLPLCKKCHSHTTNNRFESFHLLANYWAMNPDIQFGANHDIYTYYLERNSNDKRRKDRRTR